MVCRAGITTGWNIITHIEAESIEFDYRWTLGVAWRPSENEWEEITDRHLGWDPVKKDQWFKSAFDKGQPRNEDGRNENDDGN